MRPWTWLKTRLTPHQPSPATFQRSGPGRGAGSPAASAIHLSISPIDRQKPVTTDARIPVLLALLALGLLLAGIS